MISLHFSVHVMPHIGAVLFGFETRPKSLLLTLMVIEIMQFLGSQFIFEKFAETLFHLSLCLLFLLYFK